VWGAVRDPRLVAALIGGNLVVILMTGGILAASLAAFGGSAPFGPILVSTIVVQTVASIVPVSGGGTALSAVGLSGALVALGVSEPVAISAALADQAAFMYLPAIPGWFATRHLARNDYL
jgi:uncharacterized membrane protein YbhN (UPF0104 family)